MVKINSESNQRRKELAAHPMFYWYSCNFFTQYPWNICEHSCFEVGWFLVERGYLSWFLRSLVTLGINLNHHLTGKSRLILKLIASWLKTSLLLKLPKQPPRGVFSKMYSENMPRIYRRTPKLNCDFNKVTLKGCFCWIPPQTFQWEFLWYQFIFAKLQRARREILLPTFFFW